MAGNMESCDFKQQPDVPSHTEGTIYHLFRCGLLSTPYGLVGIAPQVAESPVVPTGAMNSKDEAKSLHCVTLP